jgi:hypothetical protein
MKHRATLLSFLLLTLCLPAAASAQLETPTDWKWTLDEPATLSDGEGVEPGKWWFVAMPPGWHITMGPGGLVYQPDFEGKGRFVLESELFLFPDSSEEGVGLFVGGGDLEGPQKRYTSFELRRDGAAAVMRYRDGAGDALVAWSRQDAIPPHGGRDPEKHTLRVEVTPERVTFQVNDAEVANLPRAEVGPDGRLGFRVGRAVNIHVVRLDLTYLLAPPRPSAEAR